jgi:hypothetical protein
VPLQPLEHLSKFSLAKIILFKLFCVSLQNKKEKTNRLNVKSSFLTCKSSATVIC